MVNSLVFSSLCPSRAPSWPKLGEGGGGGGGINSIMLILMTTWLS